MRGECINSDLSSHFGNYQLATL